MVLYNILDKYSGPLAEDWASGRSEKQEPNHMLSVECSSCVSSGCLSGWYIQSEGTALCTETLEEHQSADLGVQC